MANINLSRENQPAAPGSGADKSLLISLVILLLTAGVYYGLLYYNTTLETRKSENEAAVRGIQAELSSERARRVIDFARRSEEIRGHLGALVIPSGMLSDIESGMLSEVTLREYAYEAEKNTITLKAETNVIKNVARQLVAFKGRFTDVSTEKIGFDDKGNLTFDVMMQPQAVAVSAVAP